MSEPIRISPQDARMRVQKGRALLVCAYDDDNKFNTVHLDGAISYSDFISRLDSIDRSQEIIFYCA